MAGEFIADLQTMKSRKIYAYATRHAMTRRHRSRCAAATPRRVDPDRVGVVQ